MQSSVQRIFSGSSGAKLTQHSSLLGSINSITGCSSTCTTTPGNSTLSGNPSISSSWMLQGQLPDAVGSDGASNVGTSWASAGISMHEYHNMDVLTSHGVSTPPGKFVTTVEEAVAAAEELGGTDIVLKAQALTGGRGLGAFDNGFRGGVQMCNTVEQVRIKAPMMLGGRLITKQTGPDGAAVRGLFVVKREFTRHETYFGILLDRKSDGPVIIASAQGGMDIETVAETNPNAIQKLAVNLNTGPSNDQLATMAAGLEFSSPAVEAAAVKQMKALWDLFVATDATMLEINPFAETVDGQVKAMDCKLSIDDNATFRHPDLLERVDDGETPESEQRAEQAGLNFIRLDGSIGCLVNGAGLAMATMDIIKLKGGSPANFLDVGGGATREQVAEAFRILTSDGQVQSILVNIFGGIMRCDIIADGIVSAAKELDLSVPLVVRLQGTNMAEAKEIIEKSGLDIISADNLDDAALKAVRMAEIARMARDIDMDVNFTQRQ